MINAGLGNHKRDYLTSLSSIDRRAILPINIALHSYAKCKNSTHLVSYLINELRGASSSLSIVCKFPIPSGSSLSSTAHWHSHVRLRHCSLKRWTAWPGLSPTLVNASPRVTWLTWWRWPRRDGIRGTNRNMMPQEQGEERGASAPSPLELRLRPDSTLHWPLPQVARATMFSFSQWKQRLQMNKNNVIKISHKCNLPYHFTSLCASSFMDYFCEMFKFWKMNDWN